MRTALIFAFALVSSLLFAQLDVAGSKAAPPANALSPAQLCKGSPEVCRATDNIWQFFYSDHLTKRHKAEHQVNREQWLANPVPHPYLYLGPTLMGEGYFPLAYRAEGGVDVESTHLVLRALGAYDNGHKTDDGDQPNPKGHDRYLGGNAYYRISSTGLRGFFFGGGYAWSQLSTTNYTKGSGRYELGGGYDIFVRACERCYRQYSMRLGLDWVTAGQDWQNGSHGPNVTLTWPSPIEKRHWFWTQRTSIYRFHETVTEPDNPPLVRFQLADKRFDSTCEFGLVYRF